jgi:hypothetical protein
LHEAGGGRAHDGLLALAEDVGQAPFFTRDRRPRFLDLRRPAAALALAQGFQPRGRDGLDGLVLLARDDPFVEQPFVPPAVVLRRLPLDARPCQLLAARTLADDLQPCARLADPCLLLGDLQLEQVRLQGSRA